MSRAQPEQQAPPVQRLRIRYAKRGRMRFTSHRDVSRAVERAVFRARIPMAYSSGFHPHPRISYAGASPTGAATESEYVELALAEVREADAVGTALDEALPEGLDVVAVVDSATSRSGSLSDLLTGSRWRIETRQDPAEGAAEAVAAFLATDSVEVERMTKKGLRTFDCRGAVVTMAIDDAGAIDLLLEHAVPAVRPDDVLTGLRQATGWAPPANALLTRLAQGVLDRAQETLGDPLSPR
ncbi:TIGR03936 family radical SAM-associated protein [Nocardioides sambongensis]|uniref:TIGR03936 family radical SAM-associated protein n=1 Tax=Nocardioides sambongensis TaxID=2589074 RepID=UPI001E36252A|nr:TIGR03936 family radical SAM-associated protein [Nocardioides sambongensis]